jgi:nucleoside-diphosphate-sugar epimerase
MKTAISGHDGFIGSHLVAYENMANQKKVAMMVDGNTICTLNMLQQSLDVWI